MNTNIFDNLPNTPDAVRAMMENVLNTIHKEMLTCPEHSIQYYSKLYHFLTVAIMEVNKRKLITLPDGWYYSFEINNKAGYLKMKHIATVRGIDDSISIQYDECFELIHFPMNLLSVEEYAAINKVEDVTVRQWIRRGKLRSVIKMGGEWKIPEISDLPSRGYSSVRYYCNCSYISFPTDIVKLPPMHISYIDIIPRGTGLFEITADGICLDRTKKRLFTDQERAKIELILLSSENVTNTDSVIGVWPQINEESLIAPVIRTGGCRLKT